MSKAADRSTIRRRRAVAVVAIAAVIAGSVAAVSVAGDHHTAVNASSTSPRANASVKSAVEAPAVNPQRITPLVPGTAKVVTEAVPVGRKIALTFDDGICAACVKRIIDVLQQTGAHASLFPNGVYASSWEPQAARIKAMVASGQVTLGNHTFSHHASTQIGSEAFGQDLQRNEDWIEQTFGITGRPWFRPPYGDYNSGTVAKAGELGYTKVAMWSGTLADTALHPKAYLLNAIKYWARPGRIILMHGNLAPTAKYLPEILHRLDQMKLTPVTLAELAKDGTRAHSASTGY